MKLFDFMRKKKLNDKGMTLVEVLVGMMILAIVVVPTMRMFASSSSTNHSSRLRQRATLVGESVLESFKAYDMEALCKQFRGGSFKGVTTSAGTTMSVEAKIGGVMTSPFRPDDELDQDATAYTFKAFDVISEDQHYDIVIEAEPHIDSEPSVLRMESQNAYSDAIITFDKNFNTRILAEANDKAKQLLLATKPTATISSVEISDFDRVFTITVEDVGGAQKVSVKVDYTCQAKVNYSHSPAVGQPATPGTATYTAADMASSVTLPDNSSTETELVVYDNSATIAGTDINGRVCKLNQIFLYYCPVYSNTFGSGSSDEVVLEGSLSTQYDPNVTTEPEALGYMPLRVNVAKQLNTDITNTDLNNQEVLYSVRVTNNMSGGGKARLISNLNQNLSGISHLTPITYTNFIDHNTFDTGVVDPVELMYDLDVYIYKHTGNPDPDPADAIAVFTGSKNE